MRYYEDPILGKGRAADVSGGTGSADYVGGTRIAIAGETISFVNSATIQNVTGTSVTLEPDTAYKITATASAVTLNANVPEAGKWAYEGHAEIFVAGTGYIVTGANVVLANPLEPDAVNNCVLRFHDGTCIIDVEDHVYGYIVTSISGTTQGTLPYGITSATSNYIAFDATTNGSTIDLSGSTASAEKHLVGNGYTSTTLTGAVNCGTSKFTVANLALSNVQVTGGTMTLGDAFIPSGSTVAVSGGGLAVEKVTGAGSESVINLGGTHVTFPASGSANNVVITGGSTAENGGAFNITTTNRTTFTCSGCIITGNKAAYHGGGLFLNGNCKVYLSDCVVSGNTAYSDTYGADVRAGYDGGLYLLGGNNINKTIVDSGGSVVISGSNTLGFINTRLGSGSVTLTSGAILDLTGNTNAEPIAPGGGITFEQGGATVLYSSGAVSGSYMMDNATLPAGAKLTNTAVVNLGGTNILFSNGATASASGATLSGGSTPNTGGGIFANAGAGSATVTLTDCTISGCTATGNGGGFATAGAATISLTGCTVTGNNGDNNNANYNGGYVAANGILNIERCTFETNQGFTVRGTCNIRGNNTVTRIYIGNASANVIISSGASITLAVSIYSDSSATERITVLDGGCTVNGNSIPAGTYTKINSDGTTE